MNHLISVYGSSEEPSDQCLILDDRCKQGYGAGQILDQNKCTQPSEKVSWDSAGGSTDELCGQSLNLNIGRSLGFAKEVEQRECVRPPENKVRVSRKGGLCCKSECLRPPDHFTMSDSGKYQERISQK